MRLYYCFVTGATVLLGVVAARYWSQTPYAWSDAVVVVIGFLAWGVNQIYNDRNDRKADSINAPHRPMAAGKLAPRPALLLSSGLMGAFAAFSGIIAPWSLLPVAAGGVLNLLYSRWKRIPVLNCLIYGGSISMCAVYGWLGTAGGRLPQGPLLTEMLLTALYVFPAHVLMCHNSYFKDVPGDRAVGVKTLQTLFPAGVSLWLSGIFSLLYTGFVFSQSLHSGNLWISGLLLLWLLLLISVNLLNLWRKRYHWATRSNCQLCVGWVLGLAIGFSQQMLLVAGVSCLLIELLFRWYSDEKE